MKKQTNTMFQSSTEFSYKGSYVISLDKDADKDFIPEDVIVERNTVTIVNGKIQSSSGGLIFFPDPFGNRQFCLGHKVKDVKDSNGNIIWENPKYTTSED